MVNRNSLIDRAFAPFGEIYDGPGASDIDFSDYTQNALSGPTGLYDTPNREVSPTQGRWLSPDPAGLDAVDPTNPQSWNRYAYVTNNPLALTDPSGLFSVGRGDDPFDPSNDCGWTGFNDFGQDFCSIGDDEMLSPFSLPNSRLGCLDDETPGCAYGASSEYRSYIFEGENSLSWPGSGNPLADLWHDALGLPTLPCQSQFGPWCDPGMLPDPWIQDVEPGVGTNIWNCPDGQGNDPCAATWKGANQLNNPCTIGAWYSFSAALGGASVPAVGEAVEGTAKSIATQWWMLPGWARQLTQRFAGKLASGIYWGASQAKAALLSACNAMAN